MAQTHGYCDPRFDKLRDVFARHLDSGADVGATICVNIDGTTVVDLWGGLADAERQIPWQENTIINMWSISKTVTSLAALIAHERGLLNVNEKVSTYWPEFAENGKGDVLVRHLLSHSSGIPGWELPITLNDICDREASTAKLAKQAPWYEPGTVSGYQALTMGHLVGEVIYRTTGKTLKTFIAEEIAGPLGADFGLGASKEDWSRIAQLIPPPPLADGFPIADPASVAYRALSQPPPDALFASTQAWRQADIGAANGHGNARAVVRILSTISLGGKVDNHQLLSPETIDLIFHEQTNGTDLVLGIPVRFGIGFGLANKETASWIPEGRKCFWGGWVSTVPSCCYPSLS